nr:hypothetical protein CFP56_23200 [Quercus suber]
MGDVETEVLLEVIDDTRTTYTLTSAEATDALTSTTGSTSRNTHGTTHGIAVSALVEKSGKLPVRIAAEDVVLQNIMDQFELEGDSNLGNGPIRTGKIKN